jgi:hypothetical protein
MPVLKLTTTGRRSGTSTRTVMLTAPIHRDDEKAELWPEITGAYKGYAGYQRRTDRDIPVVICTPV